MGDVFLNIQTPEAYFEKIVEENKKKWYLWRHYSSPLIYRFVYLKYHFLKALYKLGMMDGYKSKTNKRNERS